ncbi:MAG: glycoside hydrolase family 2 protein [Anaerolineales bacterium]
MIKQSLSGAWQMRECEANSSKWIPATVPGGTYMDLLTAGEIPDPFLGENEKQVQWVAERDWEYCHEFIVLPELLNEDRVELVCEGLDTVAEISLNGQPLAQTNNMFRTYRWDVKERLVPGINAVSVIFRSPVAYVDSRQKERKLPTMMNGGMAHLRKVQNDFGWDWGPRLVTSGIWREIKLEGYSAARLGDVHIQQHHEGGKVSLTATAYVEEWMADSLVLQLHLTHPDGKMQQVGVTVNGKQPICLTLNVDFPQLWWPNGLGAQPLYQAEVVLADNGLCLDQRNFQVGLRTLELCQEPDAWGKTFTFVVNGVPIFAKGADWIPADLFPTRLNCERYKRWIKDTAAANMNMLRVWGGGYYEDENFYDLCDRYGILIWQDFMFACAAYPFDETEFTENVKVEVEQAVSRLRHRACLALWSGNNEIEMLWGLWKKHKSLTEACECFFYHDLPDWVAKLDPDHSYWPSSPSSGKFMDKTNSDNFGDTHLWQVWHGLKPFTYFRTRFTRFASEFGLEALPSMDTINGLAGGAKIAMDSPVMLHHQRSVGGNDKILYYLTDRFRLPASFSDLVYLTQIQQAEVICIAVEHWRRNRPRCSGALYWQLNDCWPVTSWASIDYEGRWKALQYAARRFNAQVALSLEDEGSRVKVFVANDNPQPWQGMWRWSLETLNGEKVEMASEHVSVAPVSAACVHEFDFTKAVKEHGAARLVFIAGLYDGETCLSRQTALFAKEKNMTLPDPELRWDISQDDDQLIIAIKAKAFARYVELQLENADVVFSDNFFDMAAGETVQVRCPLPNGWSVEQAKNALRVHSLADVAPGGSRTSDVIKHFVLGLKPASLVTRVIFNFME